MDILPLSDFKGNHVTKLHTIFRLRQSRLAVFFVCRKELMIYEADIKTATLR
nr:MAG TPA: hypothetical protein [Caudoviricetes sp.]